jgi:hypothetical protein
MKKLLPGLFVFLIISVGFLCFSNPLLARIHMDILRHVALNENPKDIALSIDGTTAYILCDKKIIFYSINKDKIIDSLELKENFSQIALSPNGENLFLTNSEKKQLTIITISHIFNMPIDNSPVIGNQDAKVNIYVFLDYQ